MRAWRTREALIGAMTTALEVPDATVPTITELCNAARVSRPTFYQHFGDVPSLVDAAALERVKEMFERVTPNPVVGSWEEATPAVVAAMLGALDEDRAFYRTVLSTPSSQSFQEALIRFLAERLRTRAPAGSVLQGDLADTALPPAATFLAAGTVWLLTRWLLEDRPACSAAELAEQVATLILSTTTTRASATTDA